MTEEVRRFSREELFSIVWANPAAQVSAELGIDERTLRSIDRVPGRGVGSG